MNIPAVEYQKTSTSNQHVAVIGGGISGLSAAWYLQQHDISYTLVERSGRWGGLVLTDTVDIGEPQPFIVEGGPDSFLTQKPWAWQLARELGLEDQLLGTNDEKRRVFVVNRGRLTPLPDGVLMIVPTKFMPFALSPLISIPGKLRMALDFFIKPRLDGADETLAEFVRRRLGSEALDKLAEPLMSGIYNAEAEKQSLLATFPRFRALEEKYGSLARGMIQARKSPRKSNGAPSMFISLTNGAQALIESLSTDLTGECLLNTGVRGIIRSGTGYLLTLSSGETLYADALIVATPAYVTADLLRSLAPEAAEGLAAIRYVSTGTLSLGFRADEFEHPLDGFGVVVPRSEDRPINALTWSSTKFDHRAPEGHVLLRAFFGGSRRPEMMEKSDEELIAIVRSELKSLMGVTARPLFERIYRWHRSNPQYDAGHLEHINAIESRLPNGVYLTGSAYRGIGLPDCVRQAKETAGKVAAGLRVPARP